MAHSVTEESGNCAAQRGKGSKRGGHGGDTVQKGAEPVLQFSARRLITLRKIGGKVGNFPFRVGDREIKRPLIEKEIKRVSDLLLQKEVARDQQAIRHVREGALSQDRSLCVEVPSDGSIGGESDIGSQHKKPRRGAGHKPEPMGSEFDGLTVPVLGGVVDSEKHLVERRMRREGRAACARWNVSTQSVFEGIFDILINLSKRHTKNDAS